MIFLSQKIMNKILGIFYFGKFVFYYVTWRVIINPYGIPLVLPLFNMNLTKGPLNFLESAGPMQQKKMQGIMPKYGQNAWTTDIFKPYFFKYT